MNTDPAHIAKRIAEHCQLEGIKTSTFGQKHFRNRLLYERLIKGGSITLTTYERINEIIGPDEPATKKTEAA